LTKERPYREVSTGQVCKSRRTKGSEGDRRRGGVLMLTGKQTYPLPRKGA